jgi:hypothetical protein
MTSDPTNTEPVGTEPVGTDAGPTGTRPTAAHPATADPARRAARLPGTPLTLSDLDDAVRIVAALHYFGALEVYGDRLNSDLYETASRLAVHQAAWLRGAYGDHPYGTTPADDTDDTDATAPWGVRLDIDAITARTPREAAVTAWRLLSTGTGPLADVHNADTGTTVRVDLSDLADQGTTIRPPADEQPGR